MDLRSLTYTSHATLDLSVADLETIHRSARESNGLNGVTGLLVFNGTHFLQVVEGPEPAINDLLERLRRDPRHSGLEVHDSSVLKTRNFPGWSMELAKVEASYFQASETILRRLPKTLPAEVRERLDRFINAISGTVRLTS